jgi:hypothetical protein
LFFIVVFKYLHENRTIRYIKFFFFFFKKIDFLVCIEKFRLIEDNVAIIIYVVFFWFSDSKDIDEVIFYSIFNEYSRFHLFIFFECICFFEKWKRFAIKNFEMSNLISNWFFQQFLHENQWWVSAQWWRRRSIQYVRSDEIIFRIKIFWQFDMLFNAFYFFDYYIIKTFKFFVLFRSILRRLISIDVLLAHSVFKFFINEDFLINAYNINYRTFIEFYTITLIDQIFENWQQCFLFVIY